MKRKWILAALRPGLLAAFLLGIVALGAISPQTAVGSVNLAPGSAPLADGISITAKGGPPGTCDSDHWSWVITQIDPASNAPASITTTWSNGSTISVALTEVTGGTAHYNLSVS